MNKIFLFAKHAKTSENCDKLSRSVSYETLVGGTTTAGTDIRQTQCLNKSNAGYRFCKTMRFSYENLVDRLLQTSLVFRLAKVLGLVAVLSMGMLSESWATVDSGTCGIGCNWSYNTDTKELTLSGNGTMDDYGYYYNTQEDQAPWRNYMKQIEVVKVATGSTLNNIGNRAFQSATSLIRVDMPDVKTIGNGAFNSAHSLASVSMPNVETIGDDAFGPGSSMTSVDMPKVSTIGIAAFSGISSLTSVNMPNVVEIGDNAFDGTSSLTNVNMPNVKIIGDGAFSGAGTLKSVDVPNVEEIGARAFSQGLLYIEIPEGAIIDSNAFFSSSMNSCAKAGAVCNLCEDRYQSLKTGVGCVDSCGTGLMSKKGKCVPDSEDCGDGYIKSNGNCVCASGYYKKGSCVSDCGTDRYGDPLYANNGECKESCNEGDYKKGYVCQTDCGSDYAMEKTHTCVSDCGGWYKEDGSQCVPDGWEMTDDGYIIIGDNMPEFDMDDVFGFNSFTGDEWENFKGFICRGDEEKCEEILSKYNLGGTTFDLLGDDVGFSMAGADSSNCNGFGYSWSNGACTMVPTRPTASSCSGQGMVLQGGVCVSTCGASFRLNDGECDRIRYTPAEAAQYLKDTDNEIIMTFKVNR